MRKTIYAKMTALPVGLCALAFAVTSCGSSEYKKFADNEGKQVASILRENDCLACHSENAPLPFYGNLPLIGPVVQADMKEAVHYVDLTAMVEALENGQPVSEVDLAKVENTALSGSMPPAKYSHMPMHWGTSLDDNEKETLEGVVNARAEATKTTIDPSNLTEESLKKFQSAQGELGNALSRLMLVLERYPDLKANQNFMELQAQLEGTENRISVERKRFNEVAQSYNTYIRQFPNNILSGMFGFQSKAYFAAESGAEKAPKVEF